MNAQQPKRERPRCERCGKPATVEAARSYYCDEHGGFEQIFARHGLVSITGVSR